MTTTLATTLSCTFAPALIALVSLAGAPAFAQDGISVRSASAKTVDVAQQQHLHAANRSQSSHVKSHTKSQKKHKKSHF